MVSEIPFVLSQASVSIHRTLSYSCYFNWGEPLVWNVLLPSCSMKLQWANFSEDSVTLQLEVTPKVCLGSGNICGLILQICRILQNTSQTMESRFLVGEGVSWLTVWVGGTCRILYDACRILWDITQYCMHARFVQNIFIFPQRVRKCPTIPTSEAIKQRQLHRQKSGKHPTKRDRSSDCTSHKILAVTCPPGNDLCLGKTHNGIANSGYTCTCLTVRLYLRRKKCMKRANFGLHTFTFDVRHKWVNVNSFHLVWTCDIWNSIHAPQKTTFLFALCLSIGEFRQSEKSSQHWFFLTRVLVYPNLLWISKKVAMFLVCWRALPAKQHAHACLTQVPEMFPVETELQFPRSFQVSDKFILIAKSFLRRKCCRAHLISLSLPTKYFAKETKRPFCFAVCSYTLRSSVADMKPLLKLFAFWGWKRSGWFKVNSHGLSLHGGTDVCPNLKTDVTWTGDKLLSRKLKKRQGRVRLSCLFKSNCYSQHQKNGWRCGCPCCTWCPGCTLKTEFLMSFWILPSRRSLFLGARCLLQRKDISSKPSWMTSTKLSTDIPTQRPRVPPMSDRNCTSCKMKTKRMTFQGRSESQNRFWRSQKAPNVHMWNKLYI